VPGNVVADMWQTYAAGAETTGRKADRSKFKVARAMFLADTTSKALRRLLQLIEETGPFGTLILMSYDWDDKTSWLRSMELFSRELMPALNKAVGSTAS